MSKTSKICKIHVFIVQDCSNRTLGRARGGTQRQWTKQVPSQEVAPWNPSIERDPSLPEDNGTLYPKGSLYMVNKIKYIHFMSKTSNIVKIHVL